MRWVGRRGPELNARKVLLLAVLGHGDKGTGAPCRHGVHDGGDGSGAGMAPAAPPA